MLTFIKRNLYQLGLLLVAVLFLVTTVLECQDKRDARRHVDRLIGDSLVMARREARAMFVADSFRTAYAINAHDIKISVARTPGDSLMLQLHRLLIQLGALSTADTLRSAKGYVVLPYPGASPGQPGSSAKAGAMREGDRPGH